MGNSLKHSNNEDHTAKGESINLLHVLCLFAVTLGLLATFSCQSDEEIKRQKYITEGTQLYRTYCANCHQNNGKGLESLYPPLAGSDFLAANKSAVICLIRYGQQGVITVNGKRYNRPMPAQPQLSDLDVAEITTYIYHQWGNDHRITDAKTVSNQLKECTLP